MIKLVVSIVVVVAALIFGLWPSYDYAPAQTLPFSVERNFDQPLIHTGMSKRLSEQARLEGFENINGPSLIKVPGWVENKLARDYLLLAYRATVTDEKTRKDRGITAQQSSNILPAQM